MAGSGLTWTAAELDTYLTDPAKEVPGTTMGFAGVKDAAKRADDHRLPQDPVRA